jgi:hypothetical protein
MHQEERKINKIEGTHGRWLLSAALGVGNNNRKKFGIHYDDTQRTGVQELERTSGAMYILLGITAKVNLQWSDIGVGKRCVYSGQLLFDFTKFDEKSSEVADGHDTPGEYYRRQLSNASDCLPNSQSLSLPLRPRDSGESMQCRSGKRKQLELVQERTMRSLSKYSEELSCIYICRLIQGGGN